MKQMRYPANGGSGLSQRTIWVLAVGCWLAAGGLTACSDDYEYEAKEPDFLGASIYDYLKEQGDFTTYLRLVDDLGYGQVLSLTGSKTVLGLSQSFDNRSIHN